MSRTKKAAMRKRKTTKDTKKPSPTVSSTKAMATTKGKETSEAPKKTPESDNCQSNDYHLWENRDTRLDGHKDPCK